MLLYCCMDLSMEFLTYKSMKNDTLTIHEIIFILGLNKIMTFGANVVTFVVGTLVDFHNGILPHKKQ